MTSTFTRRPVGLGIAGSWFGGPAFSFLTTTLNVLLEAKSLAEMLIVVSEP